MDLNPSIAIFRFTVVEVVRTRLWLFALMVVGVVALVATFSSSLAITESMQYRVVTYAAIIRLVAIFVVALFVSSSVLREIDEGTLDLIFSKSVSRTSWYCGKLCGYFFIVILFSGLCVVPLMAFEAQHILAWWFRFLAELSILTAAAVAFAITLRTTTITVTTLFAFYVLCRIIGSLVLMSERAANEIAQPANLFMAQAVRTLAYLLPDLGQFARASLLIDSGITAGVSLVYVVTQLIVYCVLLSSIGLFDLHRRNL